MDGYGGRKAMVISFECSLRRAKAFKEKFEKRIEESVCHLDIGAPWVRFSGKSECVGDFSDAWLEDCKTIIALGPGDQIILNEVGHDEGAEAFGCDQIVLDLSLRPHSFDELGAGMEFLVHTVE